MPQSNIACLKVFLFDFEGVLVPKDSGENRSLLEKNCKVIMNFFKELAWHGYYTGIVTLREDPQLFAPFAEVQNCTVLSCSIDKVKPVEHLLEKLNLSFDNLFYMGDDILDIPLLQKAGVSAAPGNARREAKRICDFTYSYLLIDDLFEIILKDFINRS